MNNLISVIVPVYNVEKYIRKCIYSICAQTYDNLEIILVDDGSKDNSGIICDQFADADNRIMVIHKTNGGVSSARNEGLKHVKGDYIAFCDADDWISDNMYEVLMNIAYKNNCDIVICSFGIDEFVETTVNTEAKKISSEQTLKEIMTNPNCQGYLWNKLIKTSVIFDLKHTIEFNTDIHVLEDQIFIMDCLDYANNIYITNRKLYHYFQNQDSILHAKFNYKVLSSVAGREEFYIKVKKFTNDKELRYISWSQFIKNASVSLKNMALAKNINNKKMWLYKIRMCIKKYSGDFAIGKDFSIKEKIYIWIIQIINCKAEKM